MPAASTQRILPDQSNWKSKERLHSLYSTVQEGMEAAPDNAKKNKGFLDCKARSPALGTLSLDPNFPHYF